MKLDSNLVQKIFSLLPGNVYYKDVKGRCIFCNKNQLKAFGIKSMNDYVGKTDLDLQKDEKTAKLIMENDRRVIENRQPKIYEEPFIDKDDNYFIYLTNKIPLIDETGAVIGILGISVDVTDIKEREKN